MAATQVNIRGAIREEVGKGASRRARRAGLVPAVLYGKELDSVHLDLPGHEIFLITKDTANAVLNVSYGDKEQLALVWNIQRHPVRRDIIHVDLLAVTASERVEVEVPIFIIGDPMPGTQLQQEEFAALLSAPAISIPESIDIDVSELPLGTTLYMRDLVMPEGSEVVEDHLDREVLAITEIQEIEEEVEEAEEEVEEATSQEDAGEDD